MMPWFFDFPSDDRVPRLRDQGMLGAHGPYATKEDAVRDADRSLRSSINMLRRALSALRRGDYDIETHQ